jgi:hypothetical protein
MSAAAVGVNGGRHFWDSRLAVGSIGLSIIAYIGRGRNVLGLVWAIIFSLGRCGLRLKIRDF